MAETNKYSRNVLDASLIVDKTLPNGATTVYSDSIDLEFDRADGIFVAQVDVIADAPALSTTLLPDTKTMTYKLQESDDDSTFTDVLVLGVQTGAGGAGSVAKNFIGTLPSGICRYERLAITNSGTGNASTKTATFKLAF